ncbi:hypothetical protein EJ110_NYTH46885 [Nymphaea thermarum]|nr:hypothetical protein EJ110_NYTH46885 [Nymphaea thermarum]
MTSDSFLRMMLLDGCFMLELIRARLLLEPKDPDDPVFNRRGAVMNTVIIRDMMILENQIPLLVLRKLHGIEENREISDDKHLEDLFKKIYGFIDTSPVNEPNFHVLDVYRKCLVMESASMQQTTLSAQVSSKPVSTQSPSRLHGAGEKLKSMLTSIPALNFRALCCRPIPRSNVRSAMRFHEAGVGFKRGEPQNGLKITFDKENGVLTLPFILVHNHTAAIYVNMMAFERMHSKLWRSQKMILYVGFMDSLVDTAEDVNLLCSRGIMRNMLGSDEEAAQVFNNLGVGIPYCPDYTVYDDLQEYAASYWNAARAYLKRKYFRNPWAVVSVLAGIFLLDLPKKRFLAITLLHTLLASRAQLIHVRFEAKISQRKLDETTAVLVWFVDALPDQHKWNNGSTIGSKQQPAPLGCIGDGLMHPIPMGCGQLLLDTQHQSLLIVECKTYGLMDIPATMEARPIKLK